MPLPVVARIHVYPQLDDTFEAVIVASTYHHASKLPPAHGRGTTQREAVRSLLLDAGRLLLISSATTSASRLEEARSAIVKAEAVVVSEQPAEEW